MEKKIKEYRTSEVRSADDGDKLIVEGYAAVFDSPTLIFESETTGYKYYEVVNRGAFDGADLSDVVMKYNHDDQAMVLARTRNKTLQLTVDDHGLKINAELANTSAGRDVYELIKRGDLYKMSFAFTVAEETITENVADKTIRREITKFDKVFDVAVVDFPAYDDTEISTVEGRNAEQFQKLEAEIREREQRKKLLLMTYF